MILYYDKTGVLKEIINDGSLRQGDYDIDKIYVYVDELDYVSAAVSYLLPDGETFVGPQSFANRTELQIPFDAKRDLKYFRYYRDYEFLVIPLEADQDDDNLGNGPLDQTGTVHCQISLIMLDGSVKQLGEFNFHVEESPVTNLKYVSTQEWLSLSNYQYLVGQLGAALKSQPNTTTVYTQSATGFTVRSASPVTGGYYPAVSMDVYAVNEPVFVIGGWLGNVIQYGLRIYGDRISYKPESGSTWTDIAYSDIETRTHAGQTYLAKSAGGVAYLQNENSFTIGNGQSQFTFNISLGTMRMVSSDGKILTFSTDFVERYFDGTTTHLELSDIETKTNATNTYLAKSAGGIAYLQNEYVFEIGGTSSSSVGLGRFTFDAYHENITLESSDGVLLTFNENGFERHYNDMITAVDWDDIETKSNGAQTYLAKQASHWNYRQSADGFELGRNLTDPNLGPVDDYMELKMMSTDDTDATGVGLTTLPTLSLSTTLINNPNYSDEYDISAHINALGIKTVRGVEGQYTQKYIKFKDIAQQIELGPFTSVSDLAAALYTYQDHDYTSNDMRIYTSKRTTSSITHMTTVNRRQCVYRIYTTKTPTTSKHVSLHLKVYDDDFALVDYDNTAHGDLYAVITM